MRKGNLANDAFQAALRESAFLDALKDAGLPLPQSEYRFCERRWRFDWAWKDVIV